MKFLLTLFMSVLSVCLPLSAQAISRNIIEELATESNGTVTVELSASLRKDFFPEITQPKTESETTDNTFADKPESTTTKVAVKKDNADKQAKTPTRTTGYRIQIFSDGRNQETLKSRARARAKQIVSKFPKYNNQVYSFSKAPNYYTRIGNFATRAEANGALNELRRAFPSLAGEMRVVTSEVIINQ